MNLEDREPENRPVIAKQTLTSKHAFEWPDDQLDLALPAGPDVKWIQGEHILTWALFWLITWTGTTIAGSLFGGVLGLFGLAYNPLAPLLGLLYGALWAAPVGLFVFVHLGVVFWALRWLRKPLLPAIIAGALTGLICGLLFLSPITAPLGAAGAYMAGNAFLKTSSGKNFLDKIRAIEDKSLGAMKFTMMDMLLRVTVLAVFIAGWSAWIQSF